MARVNTYLNFQGQAEEAFAFYAKAFGTEVTMLSRYSDMPAAGPGELPAKEQNLVMRAELPIIGGHVLMATDMLRSMDQQPGQLGAYRPDRRFPSRSTAVPHEPDERSPGRREPCGGVHSRSPVIWYRAE